MGRTVVNADSNVRDINSSTLTIKGNLLSFTDYFLQISNISQVSIAPVPKQNKNSIYALGVLMCIFGFGSFSFVPVNAFFFIIFAIALIGGGIAVIYNAYQSNQNLGHTLSVQLNSGHVFLFHAKSYDFLNEVLECLKKCVNEAVSGATINFGESQITYVDKIDNSTFAVGNQNKIDK